MQSEHVGSPLRNFHFSAKVGFPPVVIPAKPTVLHTEPSTSNIHTDPNKSIVRSRRGGPRTKCVVCTTMTCSSCVYKAKQRAYYWADIEKVRQYYKDNKERMLARQSLYVKENPDKRRDVIARYYQNHTRECSDRVRKYTLANPDKTRSFHAEYRKNNRDKTIAWAHNRRARVKYSGGSYTALQWKAVKAIYGNICLHCRRPESEVKLTVDHILPVSKGGHNNISNLQPLCQSCNSAKRDRHSDYRGLHLMQLCT